DDFALQEPEPRPAPPADAPRAQATDTATDTAGAGDTAARPAADGATPAPRGDTAPGSPSGEHPTSRLTTIDPATTANGTPGGAPRAPSAPPPDPDDTRSPATSSPP